MGDREDSSTPPLLPVLRLPESCRMDVLVGFVPTPHSCVEDGDGVGFASQD